MQTEREGDSAIPQAEQKNSDYDPLFFYDWLKSLYGMSEEIPDE